MTEENSIETTILAALVNREDVLKSIFPHLKPEYFEDDSHKVVFDVISTQINQYKKLPTERAIQIDLENKLGLKEQGFQTAKEIVKQLYSDSLKKFCVDTSFEWLKDTSEKYCQERSVYLGIRTSLEILDGKHKVFQKGAIPKILQDALAVCFTQDIGHDYFEDAEARFEFYHRIEKRIGSHLMDLNRVMGGGAPGKTMNVVVAPTNVGKSAILCDFAAHNLMDGLNVLYITLEMAEERISERIDANLMDVPLDQLKAMDKTRFMNKIEELRRRTPGKLVVEEYGMGQGNCNHFRALLNELHLKKRFKPDIIYVDYLTICGSVRVKSKENSYIFGQSVAEELRALAQEFNIPLWTAMQTNREGAGSSDFGLTEISESFAVAQTADFMIGLISTETLEQMGQIRVKQLKNRYSKKIPLTFMLGLDRNKMRFFDVDQPREEPKRADSAPGVVAGSRKNTKTEKANADEWKV